MGLHLPALRPKIPTFTTDANFVTKVYNTSKVMAEIDRGPNWVNTWLTLYGPANLPLDTIEIQQPHMNQRVALRYDDLVEALEMLKPYTGRAPEDSFRSVR